MSPERARFVRILLTLLFFFGGILLGWALCQQLG